ncbi:sensor histidine kinase [Fictibacillus fluitans]|uniref:histidine kinase n=1 Tax=Fictibacillus fluitans TaxID=3058422 RepID=A0ABT8I3W1_9BACL|nr:sensor histidine kinase [Fictibacillus sp. NE201]MDN4527731.1 sensor histidine kinase [Fictibacillus sp. NE201]
MIRAFLIERRSWIAAFLVLQLAILSVCYIDSSIPVGSVLYVIFLCLILFTLFLVYRYQKETKFYQRLKERENDFDLTSLPEAETPFEKIIENSLVGQSTYLKEKAAYYQAETEETKDDLLGWIHEVKTPLTALRLMIDRLEDEKLKTSFLYEWLRIHYLLDQQLHQKRLPFMENDLYMEKVELGDLLFSEIKTLQSWCIQKGIGFALQLEETEVLSDSKWLSFIVRQLLTNAVKYSKDSDILISSGTRGERAFLQITDHGRGIDPRDLPRIFEKGFTSTVHHGDHAATGMGLYLAQKAAAPLLIGIAVHSELKKGTTFTLSFPKPNDFLKITGM